MACPFFSLQFCRQQLELCRYVPALKASVPVWWWSVFPSWAHLVCFHIAVKDVRNFPCLLFSTSIAQTGIPQFAHAHDHLYVSRFPRKASLPVSCLTEIL